MNYTPLFFGFEPGTNDGMSPVGGVVPTSEPASIDEKYRNDCLIDPPPDAAEAPIAAMIRG